MLDFRIKRNVTLAGMHQRNCWRWKGMRAVWKEEDLLSAGVKNLLRFVMTECI
jgi:hypothetical protein